jgi:exonuclease VII small subunit
MSSETNAHNSTDPTAIWKDWNETTARMWPGILDNGKEAHRTPFPFDLYNFWMKSAGGANEQSKASPSSNIDPMKVWKMWADATAGVWSTTIDAYTHTLRTFCLINDAMLQNIQIPTRSNMTQMATSVAALEERVYTLEDAFVHFEDAYLKATTDQKLEDLTGRLQRIEDKLNTLLEKISTRA